MTDEDCDCGNSEGRGCAWVLIVLIVCITAYQIVELIVNHR